LSGGWAQVFNGMVSRGFVGVGHRMFFSLLSALNRWK